MIGLGEWIQQLLSMFLDYIKPWAVVEKFERGILLTWGRFPIILKPGYYPKLPLFQICHIVIVTKDTMEIEEVNVTTLDGQTMSAGYMIEFYINDVKKYFLDTHDSYSNMTQICRAIVSSKLEDITWDEIRKKTTNNAIQKKLKEKMEEMGVVVTSGDFTNKCKSRVFKVFGNSKNNNNAIIA